MKKRLPSLPEPPRSADPALRSFLSSVKEMLEVRLGRRGDPMEEAVTKRDLVEAGIANVSSPATAGISAAVVTPAESRILPPVPLGFAAEPMFGGVQLTWDNPFASYSVHAYAEIWRGVSPDPAERMLVNSSRGSVFFDRHSDAAPTTYWYWIRFVSEYDRHGPFSEPISVEKMRDAQFILEEISGQIDESALTASFRESVALLQNSWSIKLDPTGNYASGFVNYNNGTTSSFAVIADQFSVGAPGVGVVKPFVIQDGTTYINSAIIRDASIQQGKLGPISFGKITDSQGRAVTTVSGQLRAEMIDVENLRVTDANIAGVIRSNAVASNGQPRWMLDKAGGMTLNGSGAGGRMEIRDSVIKVFDSRGRLRVQIGDMSA